MKIEIWQSSISGGTSEMNELLTRPLPAFNGDLEHARETGRKLRAVMEELPIAVGLAAPQIGISERVALIFIDEEYELLIDPEIVRLSGKKDLKRESCLSVWGYAGVVERREKALVRFVSAEGEPVERLFTSFAARVVQHEVDHLNGILYKDRVAGDLLEADLYEGHSRSVDVSM